MDDAAGWVGAASGCPVDHPGDRGPGLAGRDPEVGVFGVMHHSSTAGVRASRSASREDPDIDGYALNRLLEGVRGDRRVRHVA